MSGLLEVQRALTRVCFDREPRAEDLAALHGEAERWLMYRGMVRRRLLDMARSGLPQTAMLLGADAFEAAVSAYLAEHGPRTRFIREIVHELVEHALPCWSAAPALPAHLPDLVRYEEAKWRVASMPVELPDARELDFEAPPIWNPALAIIPLRYRVDKDPRQPVEVPQPHTALVYRRPGNPRIFTYVVNDIGGRLVAAWRTGASCADGVRAVLGELGREPDAEFIDGMAGVLADLVEQQVVLGSVR